MTTGLTSEMLERYADKNGIRGRRVLSVLGKNQQLLNAMQSQVGIEFLRYLIARAETNRIAYDNMDIDLSDRKFVEARAKYKESEELIFAFLDVLDAHEKMLKDIIHDTKS